MLPLIHNHHSFITTMYVVVEIKVTPLPSPLRSILVQSNSSSSWEEGHLVVLRSHITLVRQQHLVDDMDNTVVSGDTHGGHLGSIGLATVDVALYCVDDYNDHLRGEKIRSGT